MPYADFTQGEKEFLLKIARITLEKKLRSGDVFEPQTVNQRLWENRGVFVSIHKGEELRGCIGSIEPIEALILGVRGNILLAASDPRFSPIDEAELNDLVIEISILTQPEKIQLKDIKKGDGVIIKKGANSATYLPQVWDSISDKDDFLSSLCEKAGLEPDEYKNEMVELYRYGAIVFSE